MKPHRTRSFMSINRAERRFHDPWGNKNGNKFGRIINLQYLVAQVEIDSYFSGASVNRALWNLDKPRMLEHNFGRFVRTNRRVEKLRR